MTLDGASARGGPRAIAGGAGDLSEDAVLCLLKRLLASASDRRNRPAKRAVLLARFSRLLNGLLVMDRPPCALRPNVVHALRAEHDRVLHDEVLPDLGELGVDFVRWDQISAADRDPQRTIFHDVVYPLVTPLVLDSTHPFPQLPGMSFNLGVFVYDQRRHTERFACVPLAEPLFGLGPLHGGFVRLGGGRLISVEMVVCALLDDLFYGMQVLEKSSFRVIRDDPSVQSIVLPARSITCLEVEQTMSERMLDVLVGNLGVDPDAVFRARTPISLAERMAAISEVRRGRPCRQGWPDHRRYRGADRRVSVSAAPSGSTALRPRRP